LLCHIFFFPAGFFPFDLTNLAAGRHTFMTPGTIPFSETIPLLPTGRMISHPSRERIVPPPRLRSPIHKNSFYFTKTFPFFPISNARSHPVSPPRRVLSQRAFPPPRGGSSPSRCCGASQPLAHTSLLLTTFSRSLFSSSFCCCFSSSPQFFLERVGHLRSWQYLPSFLVCHSAERLFLRFFFWYDRFLLLGVDRAIASRHFSEFVGDMDCFSFPLR